VGVLTPQPTRRDPPHLRRTEHLTLSLIIPFVFILVIYFVIFFFFLGL